MMVDDPKIPLPMSVKERMLLDDVDYHHRLFAGGARIDPATPQTRRAVRVLLKAWPESVEASRKGDYQRKSRKAFRAARAVQEIRKAVKEDGARIIELETKTPGITPKG